ncbi:MAG: hypothetical protein WBF71_09145 [Microthrixaceae bacterium]
MSKVSAVKNLQIRNVPEDVHRRLKMRAAQQGRSLSDLALEELRRSLDRPTSDDLLARIAERGTVDLNSSAAEHVRAERDDR